MSELNASELKTANATLTEKLSKLQQRHDKKAMNLAKKEEEVFVLQARLEDVVEMVAALRQDKVRNCQWRKPTLPRIRLRQWHEQCRFCSCYGCNFGNVRCMSRDTVQSCML